MNQRIDEKDEEKKNPNNRNNNQDNMKWLDCAMRAAFEAWYDVIWYAISDWASFFVRPRLSNKNMHN